MSNDRAAQIAWATFPFDDKQVPKSREFEQSVRSMSWQFLRESKGIGLDNWPEAAVQQLRRMADVASHHGEPYYSVHYLDLVNGAVPAE
jgi:hypothetical protein